MKLRSEFVLLLFACLCGALVGIVYAFVIPKFLPGFKTAWILNLGCLGTALFGGVIGYQVASAKSTVLVRTAIGLGYAAVAVIIFYFVSLFVILNVVGS
ncbi:MAG: hypothetical protein WB424_13970 [Terracidiphilus sp.]|jgi:hypothetical protein